MTYVVAGPGTDLLGRASADERPVDRAHASVVTDRRSASTADSACFIAAQLPGRGQPLTSPVGPPRTWRIGIDTPLAGGHPLRA